MIKGLAFFPWWDMPASRTIGPIRLIRYKRGHLPGDSSGATQHDIDDILGAYVTRPRSKVQRAILLEVDDWKIGDPPEASLDRLFAAREAIAFEALARRHLFANQAVTYSNFDNFTLIVQQYVEGHAHQMSYRTRRRDGSTLNGWSSKELMIQAPAHVHANRWVPEDLALITLLMSSIPDHWREAVREFNRANTDSYDITEHVELVLLKSAFEWLLQIGFKRVEFTNALSKILPPGGLPVELSEKWARRYPKAGRPIVAWANEFCDQRGAAAHGAAKGSPRFVWSPASHLALGSVLFPLLFKKIAADEGRYQLSNLDLERLRNIDQFANVDPFNEAPLRELSDLDATHPWEVVDERLRVIDIGNRMVCSLQSAPSWPGGAYRNESNEEGGEG